jgi:hypothetical protein
MQISNPTNRFINFQWLLGSAFTIPPRTYGLTVDPVYGMDAGAGIGCPNCRVSNMGRGIRDGCGGGNADTLADLFIFLMVSAMSLYVANLTNNQVDLYWRQGASAVASFRPGEVRQLPVEHPDHVAEVVKILRQYGAVPAAGLGAGRPHRGLVYSSRRPRVLKVHPDGDYHGVHVLVDGGEEVVSE